jgi:hypothetical protein
LTGLLGGDADVDATSRGPGQAGRASKLVIGPQDAVADEHDAEGEGDRLGRHRQHDLDLGPVIGALERAVGRDLAEVVEGEHLVVGSVDP